MTAPTREEALKRCPFCGEEDFDLIGLKLHLLRWCEVYDATPLDDEMEEAS